MLKTLSVHYNGGKKYENMFPIIGFYAKKILRIVGCQIET
jgi:hypothetical protein